jgi:hypothetical protein
MSTFPRLKTTAVAQYPATKTVEFQNRVLRFVDGLEQRYRESAGPLHRWEIRLNELDEGEIAAIDGFFWSNQGRLGSFTFTDPWDGASYSNCSLSSDELDLTSLGEMRGKTELTVIENRY